MSAGEGEQQGLDKARAALAARCLMERRIAAAGQAARGSTVVETLRLC